MSHNPKQKQTLHEGFEKFVIRNSQGCWGWKGCAPKNTGYGQFRHGMKLERAHRASWIMHFGEIPKGMLVLHNCDNRKCSNPGHLFLGTRKDNVLDAVKKDRHPTIGKAGSQNIMSKFTNEQVKEIRKLELNYSQISRIYKVSPETIRRIRKNLTWKEGVIH